MRFGAGKCKDNSGPSIPVVYDTGDKTSTTNLYGPTGNGLYHHFFIIILQAATPLITQTNYCFVKMFLGCLNNYIFVGTITIHFTRQDIYLN